MYKALKKMCYNAYSPIRESEVPTGFCLPIRMNHNNLPNVPLKSAVSAKLSKNKLKLLVKHRLDGDVRHNI
jgi:hypothetical protein